MWRLWLGKCDQERKGAGRQMGEGWSLCTLFRAETPSAHFNSSVSPSHSGETSSPRPCSPGWWLLYGDHYFMKQRPQRVLYSCLNSLNTLLFPPILLPFMCHLQILKCKISEGKDCLVCLYFYPHIWQRVKINTLINPLSQWGSYESEQIEHQPRSQEDWGSNSNSLAVWPSINQKKTSSVMLQYVW